MTLSALEQRREDEALGAAWRRCRAVIPKGWRGPSIGPWGAREWVAITSENLAPDSRVLERHDSAKGVTATEALDALTTKLEAR